MPPCRVAWKLFPYLYGTKKKAARGPPELRHAGGYIIPSKALVLLLPRRGENSYLSGEMQLSNYPKLPGPTKLDISFTAGPMILQALPPRKQSKKPVTPRVLPPNPLMPPFFKNPGKPRTERVNPFRYSPRIGGSPEPSFIGNRQVTTPRNFHSSSKLPPLNHLPSSLCFPIIHGIIKWVPIGKYRNLRLINRSNARLRKLPVPMPPEEIILRSMEPPAYLPTLPGAR